MSQLPTTRREFLHHSGAGIGLLAFSSFAPTFLVNSARGAAPAPERDRSILVLVQLAGGNDGLNTVVPYTDDNYYRLRPNLGLKHLDLLPISDHLALHPACGELHDLFHDGRLSVVQNVGYPNPNRSHFRSSQIWETATDANEYSDTATPVGSVATSTTAVTAPVKPTNPPRCTSPPKPRRPSMPSACTRFSVCGPMAAATVGVTATGAWTQSNSWPRSPIRMAPCTPTKTSCSKPR